MLNTETTTPETRAAIDAWVESEAAAAKWRDDGHTARVRIQDRTLIADLLCPHDGRDLTALPIDQAPKCRRGEDEYDDGGERVGPGPLLGECVLATIGKSWQNDELWAEGIPDQEVPRSPFPVLWRGRDQDDIEIKPKAAAGQPADDESREWGHRFVDGTGGPDDSREAALELATRFVPGFVEIVHRAGPDAEWVRDDYQPHVPSERLDQMAAHIASLRRSNDWRGHRLVELGEHPNPPRDRNPIRSDLRENLSAAFDVTLASRPAAAPEVSR